MIQLARSRFRSLRGLLRHFQRCELTRDSLPISLRESFSTLTTTPCAHSAPRTPWHAVSGLKLPHNVAELQSNIPLIAATVTMGHAQSRQQHDDGQEPLDDHVVTSSHAASHRASQSNDSHASHSANREAVSTTSRRKRRRDSASVASSSTIAHQPLSQRRRMSPRSDTQSRPATPLVSPDTDPIHLPTQSSHPEMDLDAAEPPIHSLHSAQARMQTAEASSTPTDTHHVFVAAQSRVDTPSVVQDGETPPPHLDALHDERERARRQILEALASTPRHTPSLTTPVESSDERLGQSTTMPGLDAPSIAAPSAAPSHPLASAAIAALLGAIATVPATDATGLVPATPDSAASLPHLQPPPQPQHPQPARPPTFRTPLQPEIISGTSMVVQGALVARTLANRPATSDPSSPTDSSQRFGTRRVTREPATTRSPSNATAEARTGADSFPDVPETSSEGDSQRGAVTLEEQAVMLSRILGIAAAATAASLLNTSEAQHVDPSLLQTSLRRPFERMNQTPSNRTERWLADWQRASSHDPLTSVTSRADPPSSHALGNGFRSRLASLSRRSQSAFSRPGFHNAQPLSDASTRSAPDDGTVQDPAGRQEIISHLLSAAEREAASQRRTRLRSVDAPTTRTEAEAGDAARASRTQHDTQRSSLSQFVRSTLGSLLHPGRLLPTRSTRSTDTQLPSSSSHRSDWTRGSAASSGLRPATRPSSDFSLGPNDVSGTLRQVRNGILPDGVPGSFGSFLNHLVNDLMAAVQLMRPSSEEPLASEIATQTAQTTNYFEHATEAQASSGAEVLDGETATTRSQPASSQDNSSGDSSAHPDQEDAETQARRQRDFQNGNLSFFRLFRFDPVAPSQLVPCIVVGVRSLNVTERFGEEIGGARAAGADRDLNGSRQQTSRPTTFGSAEPEEPESTSPRRRQRAHSEGASTLAPSQGGSDQTDGEELPASRFMLFVSGGRYPPNHPLLTSNPSTAGRDLMILMDLLSTMQAMQHKPSTVTQREIDASDLLKIKGCQVADQVRDGKITENTAERCLVCLEDWREDDDCRVLACRHAFHTLCVDRWLTSSSNTCPMCRRQGVSKDGRQAGAETADSRRAAQA